jgi:putative Holliday junction resolvase
VRTALALDLGRRRIGLAVSDASGLARGLETVTRKTRLEDIARIARIARERNAGVLVVGLPLNMDGSAGPQAEFSRRFAGALGEATGLPVELHDERLTSVEAERRLRSHGWTLERFLEQKRKGAVDRMAAIVLLEDWLRAGSGTE